MRKSGSKRASSREKRPPSREQVRTWLNTVISPMLSALSVELDRAGRNWSFRWGPKDFEFFWSTDSMVGPYFGPNRSQLFRYCPDLVGLARRHDEVREDLRAACERAFERVLVSPGFQRLAQDVEPQDRCYLAEYLVNGLEDLPARYSLSEYWSKKGRDYLNIAEDTLAESWREIERKGSNARTAIAALKARLEELQATLSDEFGLPPIDPAGAMTP